MRASLAQSTAEDAVFDDKWGEVDVHVMVCHPSAELYGSDRMALEAVVGLVQDAMRVTVVLPVDGPLREEMESVGADVIIEDVPVLRKSALKPAGFLRLVGALMWHGPRMMSVLRRVCPDVVYVNTIVQPWWALAARVARRETVIHVREAEVDPPAVVRRALLAPLALAHSVVANSLFTADQIMTDCPRVSDRLKVIYNGKDWSAYDLEKIVSVDSSYRILFLGRLSPRKGTDIAVRAVGQLRAEGRDVSLTIAGAVFPGYEWFEKDLRDLCGELMLGPEVVKFTGFVDRPHELFRSADVLVVPSRAEPFGTVAAEGLAASVPVVVADTQGLTEIVEDGRFGLVVPSDDPEALAAAVARLMDDPVLCEDLVTRGKESVEERFSRSVYRAAVAAEIRRVAAGARAKG